MKKNAFFFALMVPWGVYVLVSSVFETVTNWTSLLKVHSSPPAWSKKNRFIPGELKGRARPEKPMLTTIRKEGRPG